MEERVLSAEDTIDEIDSLGQKGEPGRRAKKSVELNKNQQKMKTKLNLIKCI